MTPEPDPMAGAVTSVAAEFSVVGIGASAGGLAALEAFFSALPTAPGPGMAFVIVQHLAPDHTSILTELIQRYTSLQVLEVENGVKLRPDCIYTIPPNRDLALLHGRLQLLEPSQSRHRRLPIDFFLKSLAQDQHERAIAIVLSGTGSDGALGGRAIKGEGGMVMVQQPESAEYDGMPRSAIATGVVDFVLPVAEMPQKLIAYAKHALGTAPEDSPAPFLAPGYDALATIFVLLRNQTGHDFSRYKQSTISRRIQRRMAVHQIASLEEYVRLLQETPTEIDDLFRDLLIRVTSFFRDAEVFENLKSELGQRVFQAKEDGQSIRVWVPACCTGEEAYTLAILLQELKEECGKNLQIQVFATDIDSKAIDQARSGVYPAGIASDMTPERLSSAFDAVPDTSRYRVKKYIRDLIVFSEQDAVRDPPFSRLDLISCRNLMIYLGAELQAKLFGLFHYALHPGGLLLLGTSESVGDLRELFVALDAKSKLYLRSSAAEDVTRAGLSRASSTVVAVAAPPRHVVRRSPGARLPLRALAEREMLQQFAAAGALVNERGDILYLHGRTGHYLEPTPGESSLNVLMMAREGLRPALTATMHEVVTGKKSARRLGLLVRTNGHFTHVDLTIRPVAAERSGLGGQCLYLIVFEAAESSAPTSPIPVPASEGVEGPGVDAARRIDSLEEELRAQTEYLDFSRREVESSNDDLKASNEELQSLNEEMQSTNEEMETSKEELQSVNEELATVNAELQQRVLELSRSNNDLSNLISGTGVGIIFVDMQLRVQRFTPDAVALVNLIPSDVGRALGHISTNLVGYDRLLPDVSRVLDTLVPIEVEVHTANAWYLLRMRPYRTMKNVIEGAVITFTDITELKNGEEGLRRLAVVVRDSRDAVVVHDLKGRILAWNPGAERLYGWTEVEALAMNVRDLIPADLREKEVAMVQRLGGARSIQPSRSQRLAKDGHLVTIELTVGVLINAAGDAYAISTTEREHHD